MNLEVNHIIAKLNMLRYRIYEYNDWAVVFGKQGEGYGLARVGYEIIQPSPQNYSIDLIDNFVIISTNRTQKIYVRNKPNCITDRFKWIDAVDCKKYRDYKVIPFLAHTQGRLVPYLINYRGKLIKLAKSSYKNIKLEPYSENKYIVVSYGNGLVYNSGMYQLNDTIIECVIDENLNFVDM